MITIDYSEREKLEKLVNDIDLKDLMDTQAIPYIPGNTYTLRMPIDGTVISAELHINNRVFTSYTVSSGYISFVVNGNVNGQDTFVVGVNTVEIYVAYAPSGPLLLRDSRYVQCKNIMAFLLWIATATDESITKLATAFTYPSLQTMPLDVAEKKFNSLLPKYYYLDNTTYRRLLISLFSGSVFSGTWAGLRTLMEGFLPSTMYTATIQNIGTKQHLLYESTKVPYKEVNTYFPFKVYDPLPSTTVYIKDKDYVLKEDPDGMAYIQWLTGGNAPGGVTYLVDYFHASYTINPSTENAYWKLQDHTLYAACDLGGASLGYSYLHMCGGSGNPPPPGSTAYPVWQEQNKLHYFSAPIDPSFTLDERMRWAKLLSTKMKSMGFIINWYGFLLYQHLTYKYILSGNPVKFETGLSLIAKDYVVGSTSYPIVYYYNGPTKVYLTTGQYSLSREGTLTINSGVIPTTTTVHIELYFVPIKLIQYCQNIIKQQQVKIVNIYYNKNREPLKFWGA